MAEDPHPATSPVEEARLERARLQEALHAASEVLAIIAGQSAAPGTSCPSTILVAVDQDQIDISACPPL